MFSPPLKKSIVFLKYALKMDLVKGAWFDLYVRFDDFLCMDAFRMGIKSKDDLRRYSIEELEKMCPKDKRLFVRLKKMKTVYG